MTIFIECSIFASFIPVSTLFLILIFQNQLGVMCDALHGKLCPDYSNLPPYKGGSSFFQRGICLIVFIFPRGPDTFLVQICNKKSKIEGFRGVGCS